MHIFLSLSRLNTFLTIIYVVKKEIIWQGGYMTDIFKSISDKEVIILIEDVDCLALHALAYAKEISKEITIFSAITRQDKEKELRSKWDKLNIDLPYIIQYSQNKSAGMLLSEFIDSSSNEGLKDVIVIVPLVIIKSWWQRYLNRNYLRQIERSLIGKDKVVLIRVPYYLDHTA